MDINVRSSDNVKYYLGALTESSWTAYYLFLLACSIPLFTLFTTSVDVIVTPKYFSDKPLTDLLYYGWTVLLAIPLMLLILSRSASPGSRLASLMHFGLTALVSVCVLALTIKNEEWALVLIPVLLIALNYGKKWAIAGAALLCLILVVQIQTTPHMTYSEFSLASFIILLSSAYLVGGMTDNVRSLIGQLDHERIMLERLINRLPLGVCLVDQNGGIKYCNPSIGPTERRLCEYLLANPGKLNQSPSEADDPVDTSLEFEDNWYRIRHTICPGESSDNMLLIIENLSETRRLEEEVRKASYLASIGEMAAGVAHEIRNPLTVISGYLQLLSEKKESTKIGEVKSYLGVALEEINRLAGIVHDFLNMAKPQELNKIPLSLTELLIGVREFLEKEAWRKDVRLSLELDPSANMIMGDPANLKQVVFNLVTNAFQAAGQNGEVTIRTYQRNRWAFLEVTDNGPGIPEDLQEKVFAPFFSTKPSGTGIGLAISRRIILDHGGSLTFRSKPGETRFIMQIPLAGPDRSAAPTADQEAVSS